MKIIHVVRQFSPSVGGLETAVLNLADAQREYHGIDARVVTLDRIFGQKETLPRTEIIASIPVCRLPWRGSKRYALAPSVLSHLQSADLVHIHAIDFFFDFLALTRPLHRRKMIASTHGGFFHTVQLKTAKRIWFNSVTRASILAYNRIVATSHSDADIFRNIAGHCLTVVGNGVDLRKFNRASSSVQTRTIIYFGRFAKHKRIELFFPILARLRARHPAWRMIVAGHEADQTVRQLKAMAAGASVADVVRFVLAPDDTQLRSLIGEASYFVCLSSYEGFGLAPVEAMSAGLLPILSDISPFARLVRDTRVGLIIDANTPDDVAAATEATILNDSVAYLCRRVCISDAVRRYNWETVAAQYVRIYGEVIDTAVDI